MDTIVQSIIAIVLFFGILLGCYVEGYNSGYTAEGPKFHTSIEECEKQLPRDLNCKLVAIVDYGDTK